MLPKPQPWQGTLPHSTSTFAPYPLLPFPKKASNVPSLAGNILHLSVFAVLFFIRIFLGIHYRTWGFLVSIVCRLALEVMGYVGRVQPHYNPFPFNLFLEYVNHPVQPHLRTPHALFHGHSIANIIQMPCLPNHRSCFPIRLYIPLTQPHHCRLRLYDFASETAYLLHHLHVL